MIGLAVAVAYIAFVCLCMVRWDRMLLAYMFLLPFLPALATAPGYDYWSALRLLYIPLLLAWAALVLIRRTTVPKTAVDRAMAAWILANMLATAFSADLPRSIVRSATMIEYIGLYYIIVDAVRHSPGFRRRMLGAIAWGYAAVVAYSLMEIALGRNLMYAAGLFSELYEDYVGTHLRAGITRIAGPIGQPINLALYLGVLGPVVASYWYDWSERGRLRVLGTAVLVGALVVVFWTVSRGPWLGTLVGLIVLAVLRGLRPTVLLSLATGFWFLVWLINALGIGADVAQFLSLSVEVETNSPEAINIASRLEIVWVGLAAVGDHPLFGLGPGVAFHDLGEIAETTIVARYGELTGLENQYVYTALDTGLVGLTAYILLIVCLARSALRAARRAAERRTVNLALAVCAGVVTFALTSVTVQVAGFQTMWIFALVALVVDAGGEVPPSGRPQAVEARNVLRDVVRQSARSVSTSARTVGHELTALRDHPVFSYRYSPGLRARIPHESACCRGRSLQLRPPGHGDGPTIPHLAGIGA